MNVLVLRTRRLKTDKKTNRRCKRGSTSKRKWRVTGRDWFKDRKICPCCPVVDNQDVRVTEEQLNILPDGVVSNRLTSLRCQYSLSCKVTSAATLTVYRKRLKTYFFIPLPALTGGGRGTLVSGCTSGHPLTPILRDAISLSHSGGMSMKPATDIYRVSGHCW